VATATFPFESKATAPTVPKWWDFIYYLFFNVYHNFLFYSVIKYYFSAIYNYYYFQKLSAY